MFIYDSSTFNAHGHNDIFGDGLGMGLEGSDMS